MIKNLEMLSKKIRWINEWWNTGNKINMPEIMEREIFGDICQHLITYRIIQLLGARRVGKTTLLKQTVNYLLEKENPRNIFYCSLDDPAWSVLTENPLDDVLDYFLENVAQDGKKYVLFDEVHTIRDWYKWMKSFFDKYAERDIKFIISGSSSLTLQKEANQYLRGRTMDLTVFPLSFNEFLKFNGINVEKKYFVDVKRMDVFEVEKIKKDVSRFFMDYLLVGGFPEWFSTKDVHVWFENIINDIPKKAIYEDVANLFNIKSPKTLENIFEFIVENQSRILSYEKINEIAGLHRSILLNYIEYLKNSYLIVEVPKFAKTIKEQIKSQKKYLCIDQGLRNAVFKDYEIRLDNIGFIVENAVGIHLALQGKTYYIRDNGEIDFIYSDKNIIPIEVKYSENPDVTKMLLNFIDRHNLQEGIVISKNSFKKEVINRTTIYFIPAWFFLTARM